MSGPRRILSVVSSLGRGGTERAAATFAVEFSKMGLDSTVWAVDAAGERAADLLDVGVRLIVGRERIEEVARVRPDLIHLHSNGLDDGTVRALASLTESRIVEQNVFATPTPWTDLLHCSFQLTPGQQAMYLGRAGGRSIRTAVVPNPVDTEGFFRDIEAGQAWRRTVGIPADARIIGRVGQPITYKWSPLLFSAFDRIAAELADVWLVVVGPPSVAVQQVSRLKARSRVVVVPMLDSDEQVRTVLSGMDVFGHAAAQGESFGYSIAEAMLCEVPVVTLSTPWADNAQTELVRTGQDGYAVESNQAFIHALRHLLTERDERTSQGRAGREGVCARYESAAVAVGALEVAGDSNAAMEPYVAPTPQRSRLGEWVIPKIAHEAWRWLPAVTAARVNSIRERQR